ncbi:hypothetical protein BDZ85DRAFT_285837 [Elsinoe ampelina]|uniref:Glycosyltransferase n=1 Tax=Elsinoe ampelina TaxID=302913 RepID=A0A6A6FZN2_9PEZI|nr:hypothetical protein BDZ85DRAFT_285837 [Elsinoe ampelina]
MPSHILAIPFPGAGHTINMINTATALATPSLQVHLLVLSLATHNRNFASSGQSPNPNIHLVEIADGQHRAYADEHDPSKLIGFITGADFSGATRKEVEKLNAGLGNGERVTSALLNPLMGGVIRDLRGMEVKVFGLFPSPWYMCRVAMNPGNVPGANLDTEVDISGVGDVDGELTVMLGDAVDVVTEMYHRFVRPIFDLVEGWVVSNSNLGLEGHGWRGKVGDESPRNFMVGPMIPDWYLGMAEKGYRKTMQERAVEVEDRDGVLSFVDGLPEKSAVYVALGSHSDFSKEQALLVIDALRSTETPFVFLHREDPAGLREAVGPDSGGIITGWAPQLEVLAHPAIKFALSHGGFGTMMEGIFAGVPFVTCPVGADQFLDTKVMQHLGMLLGTFGVNKRRPRMAAKDGYPILPDDNGQTIRNILGELLGSEEGARRIEVARSKTLEIRKKILTSKKEETPAEFEALRSAMSA